MHYLRQHGRDFLFFSLSLCFISYSMIEMGDRLDLVVKAYGHDVEVHDVHNEEIKPRALTT